jgi:hypothetical protein
MKRTKHTKVPYRLVEEGSELDSITKDLIIRNHDHLTDATIRFVWNLAWKPDKDGVRTLGKAIKVAEPYRSIMRVDLVIAVAKEPWDQMNEEEKVALIDHELTHFDVHTDPEDGYAKLDELDRIVYRLRRHDFEDFAENIERHGLNAVNFRRFAKEAKLSKINLQKA